ncbi:hypothetical protein H9P43_009591 [Blastocladiella emersonii ATCC 22665]|nr:hypothetical protein H9P43_009591 [Blastocladiella emersonii ATCC 22665]
MKLLNALLIVSLLSATGARAAEVDRRAPVQPGAIPAPATWGTATYSSKTFIPPGDEWYSFNACYPGSGTPWTILLDHPHAATYDMVVDVVVSYPATAGYDTPHAYLWSDGKWVALTEAAEPVNLNCIGGQMVRAVAGAQCWANPNVPKLSATIKAGSKAFAFGPITGTKCTAGMFRYRFVEPPPYCTSTSAPDYVVPRDTAGAVATAALPVAQLACNQIGADLAPVTSKNAVDVAKAGIDCIGLGKQALVASWEGNSYDQPGLLLSLPSKAGKSPSVNVADPSTPLPPICKLRKSTETEFGLVVGADSPVRVVVLSEGVDAASAAAVCTRRGYSLADLKSGSGSGSTFATASGVTYQALGSGGKAWIHSYDGDAYAGSCIALTAADSPTKAGSVNVPAGGCTGKLDAVVCQTAAASTAPMQRRSEL